MITKKTAMLVVVLGALAAWLAAAATSSVTPARPAGISPAQIDLRGEVLAAEIERLHDRLRPTASPDHGRNLFQFAPARPALARVAVVETSAAASAAEPAAAPVDSSFKLIGIAEDGGARTAILSAPGQLLMVKDGDAVAAAYRVTGISPDTVELTATSDGHVLRLALK